MQLAIYPHVLYAKPSNKVYLIEYLVNNASAKQNKIDTLNSHFEMHSLQLSEIKFLRYNSGLWSPGSILYLFISTTNPPKIIYRK